MGRVESALASFRDNDSDLFRHQSGYGMKRLRVFTCAVRIMALSAFCPVTATFRSPMGGRRALPGPLLSAVGTGH